MRIKEFLEASQLGGLKPGLLESLARDGGSRGPRGGARSSRADNWKTWFRSGRRC